MHVSDGQMAEAEVADAQVYVEMDFISEIKRNVN